ncbi:hypothetical protein [Pelosinus baikalensis]|uniref:Peptidase M10 metallopeptidase domain-containing protein n=1 Tax=Pelosinus baikalensis TaxID=2892015 RepID=A0ABS8HV71_9FIRM|nr:hypothetical protein [Pelosinus baikalensis]MCC5466526.1 hypothetical protein [Pelosinus baikalensis]
MWGEVDLDVFDISKDDKCRARHEIGHVLVLEQTKVDWEYVTILSDDGNQRWLR